MQKSISWILSLIIILQPALAAGQSTTIIESDIVPGSIEVLPDEAVSYYLDDNLGGRTYMEFNIETRRWLSVGPDESIRTGIIPQSVIDEQQTQEIPLPCFGNPYAALGCLIGGVLFAFTCEVRADNNIRRFQNNCPPGTIVQINRISGCGTVEAGGCVPLDQFGDPDPAPDPGNGF